MVNFSNGDISDTDPNDSALEVLKLNNVGFKVEVLQASLIQSATMFSQTFTAYTKNGW